MRKGKHGKHIRIYCHDCRKKITINQKDKTAQELLKDHLNRNSYRMLEAETGISKKTICSLINTVTNKLIHSNELTSILQPKNYCGVLLVDGKFVPVKEAIKKKQGLIPRSKKRQRVKKGLTAICYVDYLTHDIPIHITALSENRYDIRQGFKKLHELGYELKVLVCDESMGEIAQVAKEFYPEVIIQYCIKHYTASIDRVLKVNGVKRSIAALENKLANIGNSIFISTHHYDIEKARKIVSKIAELEFEYGYLIEI